MMINYDDKYNELLGGQQGGAQVNTSGAGSTQTGTGAGGLMQPQSSQPGGQQQAIPTSQANSNQIGIQVSFCYLANLVK